MLASLTCFRSRAHCSPMVDWHEDDRASLLGILADWVSATGVRIYLYGSRARGDHRIDSDVDIQVRLSGVEGDSLALDENRVGLA